VPAARVPRVAEICNACGALPLAGVTESQDESLLAVKERMPLSVFVTFTVAGAGFVPLPFDALNERVDCEMERTGSEVVAEP
jgi:hypothetical protein